MARTKNPKKPANNVVEMEAEASGGVAVAEEEPKTPFGQPATPAPAAPAPPPPPVKRKPTFFQRVAAVPKADWGTRVFIYVYCLEPICNLKMGGESKYLVRLSEPIADEQALMVDYGSGKYRLQMVNRKPGAHDSDTTDLTEIEIYNPKYPPKIPRSVWMNDPRNERWAALLPKEEPPVQPTGLGTVTDAFKTFTEIQKDIREQFTPPPPPVAPPPPDRVQEFKGMLEIAKGLMPQPAPATDNKVLDTVVQLMMKQLDASQQETKELRKELRDAMQLRQADSKGETFETIIDKFEKIAPKLTNLLGLGGEKVTDIVHGRRRGFWEDLALQTVPEFVRNLSPTIPLIVGRFLTPNGPGLGMPVPNGAPAALPPGAPPPAPDPLHVKVSQFLGSNLGPMQKAFQAYMAGEERDPNDKEQGKRDGTDFAAWVEEYHGEQYLKDFRALGSANILAMFKATPGLWSQLQPYEVQLTSFIDQVLSYELTPAEVPPAGPVDLSEEEED